MRQRCGYKCISPKCVRDLPHETRISLLWIVQNMRYFTYGTPLDVPTNKPNISHRYIEHMTSAEPPCDCEFERIEKYLARNIRVGKEIINLRGGYASKIRHSHKVRMMTNLRRYYHMNGVGEVRRASQFANKECYHLRRGTWKNKRCSKPKCTIHERCSSMNMCCCEGTSACVKYHSRPKTLYTYYVRENSKKWNDRHYKKLYD
jgi:hypothetical protein